MSFAEMYRLQEQVGKIVMADPAVATLAMGLGTGTGNATSNNGRMFITLKPRDDRDVDAFQVISRLRPKLARIPGMRVYLQAAQDVTVGGRAAKTQFQYTLQDANVDALNTWAPKILAKATVSTSAARRGDGPAECRTTLSVQIDRDMASRYGIQPQLIDDTLYDAFGQRQVTQYFTQLNTYDVVLEITPQLQMDPAALEKLYIRSPTTNQMVPLSAFAKWTTDSGQGAFHQSSGPVSRGHHQLQPGVGRSARSGDGGHPGRDAGNQRALWPDDERSRVTHRLFRICCPVCRC